LEDRSKKDNKFVNPLEKEKENEEGKKGHDVGED
jgi:hypothetical protein